MASSWKALDPDIGTGQQLPEQLVIKITSLPTNGTVTFKGTPVAIGQIIAATDIELLSYTASGDDLAAVASESLGITISDGGGGSTDGTIDFFIAPKNVKPSVGNQHPTLIEGQTLNINPGVSLGDRYDEDHPHTILIENVITGGQGDFSYTTDQGQIITLKEGQSYELTLTESKTLVFKHNGAEPNKPDAIAPSYSITVTDAGGGEEGVKTSSSGKIDVVLRITPNNDDPVFNYGGGVGTKDNPLELPESVVKPDSPGSVIKLQDYLKAQDDDVGTSNQNLVYTLTGLPEAAEIQLYVGGNAGYDHDGDGKGDGWVTLGKGARFTQADVDGGLVRIMQTGPGGLSDSFSFQVRDSAYGLPTDSTGALIPGAAPQEGAVRDENGLVKDIVFYVKVIPNTDPDATNTHPTGPHDPTPGYGTGNGTSTTTPGENGSTTTVTDGKNTWTNKIEATVTDPGNKANNPDIIWNEGNVGADGGYVISDKMLGYEITRSLDDGSGGTPIELKVPPSEVVYTMLQTPGNGSIQKFVDGNWVPVSTLGQFTQQDIIDEHIRFVSDGGEMHDSSFKFAVSDGTNLSFTSSFTIDITPTNDRPVAGGGSATVVEGPGTGQTGDSHTVYLDGNAVGMSDADGSTTGKDYGEGVKDPLWFQITSLPAEGKLEYFDGDKWVEITADKLGNWYSQNLLTHGGEDGNSSGLRYVHNGTEPLAYPDGPRVQFEYQVRDDYSAAINSNEVRTGDAPTDTSSQGNLSEKGKVTIHVTPVNNAPLIQLNPDATAPTISGTVPNGGVTQAVNEILYVDESGTGKIDKLHLVAIDSDNTTVQRQYQITQVPTQGTLMLGGKPLGVGSTFTQADIDNNKLTYVHNGDEPGDLTAGKYNDLFKFKVSDGDATSAEGSFWINIKPLNDAPTIEAATPADKDKTWVIDSSNTWVNLPNVTIDDPDLANGIQGQEVDYIKVTVELKEGDNYFDHGKLQTGLQTSDGGDISGLKVTGSGSNKLVLEGTLEQVQNALKQLQAKTDGTDVNKDGLSLVITVDDRLGDSANGGGEKNANGTEFSDKNNTATITFKIAASDINDVPVITPPNSDITVGNGNMHFIVTEDTLATLSGMAITDVDDFGLGQNYSITVSVEHGSLNGQGKTITLTGQTLAQVNAFLKSLSYKADPNFNGNDTLKLTVNDGGNHGKDGIAGSTVPDVKAEFKIYIRPQNDAPVITLPNQDSKLPLTDGQYEFTGSNIIQIADVDIEDAQNSANSSHQLNDIPATVTITATHNNAGVGSLILKGSAEDFNVTVTVDAAGKLVLVGKIADINALLAKGLRYETGADNSNIDGQIVFTVMVDDAGNGGTGLTDDDIGNAGVGDSLTDTRSLIFLVTQVNDAPSFGGIPTDKPPFVQGGSALVLTPNGDLIDPELDLFNNWEGSTLTISHDDLSIIGGEFGFSGTVTVRGNDLLVNNVKVGTVDNNSSASTAGGTLTIKFDSNANATTVDTVLKSITYKNNNTNAPREITLNYFVQDGNSNTGGNPDLPNGNGQNQGTGGEKTGNDSLTITIDRPISFEIIPDYSGEHSDINDHVVYESGLPGGSDVNADDLKVDSSFTVTAPDGLDQITIEFINANGQKESKTFTLSELQALKDGPALTIKTQYGELQLKGYTLSGNATTIDYEYVLTKAPTLPGEFINDSFVITAKDQDSSGISSKSQTLNIKIVDDAPKANDDENNITEDDTLPTTGNVLGGAGKSPGDQADTQGADGAKVSGITNSDGVAGQIDASLTGKYGSLVIHEDGSYSYTLDNNNLEVQGLITTDAPLTETYTYTIVDADGDTSTATLTILIHGSNDGVTVIVPETDDSVTEPDGNTKDHVVFESGLKTGSKPNDDDVRVDSSFSFKALDGVGTVTISVGGFSITITKDQLEALASQAQTVSTQYGTLELNGYARAADGTITVSYTYTLTSAPVNPGPDQNATKETFTVKVVDRDGDEHSADFSITIIDDAPTALNDTATLDRKMESASGDVIGSDKSGTGDQADLRGADGSTLESIGVGGVKEYDTNAAGDDKYKDVPADYAVTINGVTYQPGTPIPSPIALGPDGKITVTDKFGTLVISKDGTYTFTRDPDQKLGIVREFSYTIVDEDGDKSTATLTIYVENRAPIITNVGKPVPEDGALSPSNSVKEAGLANGSDPGQGHTTEGVITFTPGNGKSDVILSFGDKELVVDDQDWKPGMKLETGYGTVTITDYDPVKGKLSYTYTLTKPFDNAASNTGTDSFQVTVRGDYPDDADDPSPTAKATVTVEIIDDAPVANDDFDSIFEDATEPATGNVITMGPGKDAQGADGATVTGVAAGGTPGGSNEAVSGNVGKEITDAHGTLVLNADGSYTFTLNNDNLEVQGLKVGQTLVKTYTYTIKDADGDTSTATLTITINGTNDGVTVVIPPTDHSATTPDGNVNDHVVFESGLKTGSQPNDNDLLVESSFTLKALDGVSSLTISYEGTDWVISADELKNLGTTSKTITTPYGQLVLNGYAQASDGTITVQYTYTLTSAPTNPNAASTNTTESFTITVTDSDDVPDTASAVLNITIVDDSPTAANDSSVVDNSTDTATGNALKNDTLGADQETLVIGVSSDDVPGSAVTTNPDGSWSVKGEHGTLTIKPDGSYTYVRFDGKPLVATDVFSYTIADKDGDQSSAKITISIADHVPSVTDKDGQPPEMVPDNPADPDGPKHPVLKPDGPVSEAGIPDVGSDPDSGSNITTGTIVLKPGDGDSTVTITPPGGNPVVLVPGVNPPIKTPQGEVTFTYTEGDPSTSTPPTITYEYVLKTPVDDSSKSPTDEFKVTVTDDDGDSTTVTVVIDITDDVPTAADDSSVVDNSTDTATGNALKNDTLGADQETLVIGVSSDDVPGSAVTTNPDGSWSVKGEHGTLTIKPDGSYTYVRFDGKPLVATDVFSYTIADKDGDQSSAKITISIADKAPTLGSSETGGNTPPHGSVHESGLPDGSDPDSGSNKTTGTLYVEDGDDSTTVTITPPGGTSVTLVPGQPTEIPTSHGTVTVTYTPGNGGDKSTITYEYELKTPTDGSAATPPSDQFTITVTDGDGDSVSSTVTIDIVDDVPDAQDDANTTLVNVPVEGELSSNDKPGADGPLTWTVETQPSHGTVSIDPSTGHYIYTPVPGFIGTDTFTYTVTDKDGSTDTATVTITVTNQPPVAFDDSNVTKPGEPAKGNVITGGSDGDQPDSDPDGQPVTLTEITVEGVTVSVPPGESIKLVIPNKGVLEIGSDGSYTFTPNALWSGQVPDIHYTISDGFGGTATAVLRITATAAPMYFEPPARPDSGGKTDVGTTTPAPLTGGSSSLLILSDAMTDTPSVFWESYRYFQDMRVPTVVHPITYVNLEVQRAQLEAVQGMLDNWPSLSDAKLRSMSLGLGQDPNLFVQHAVRAVQQERKFWEFLASELKANLPTEAPAAEAPFKPSEELNQAEVQSENSAQAKPQQEEQASALPQALSDLLERWNTAQPLPEATGMMSALMAGKSSSFSEQLQQSAHELPGHLG